MSGRSTLLCSSAVVTTCPPLTAVPNMAVLSASVQLMVNMTLSGGQPKNFAAAVRVSSTIMPALTAMECEERVGLADRYLSAVPTAFITLLGLK